MAGNIFSNTGLMARGSNDASLAEENLAQAKQQTAAGTIKLGDIQREDLAAKALREATANATPDSGIQGAFTSYANQQKANGDFQGYQATVDAQQNHALQVASRLAQATAYGLPTDQTEKYLAQAMGQTFVPGSLEYGTDPQSGKHMASVIDAKSNQRVTIMPDAVGFLNAVQPKTILAPGAKAVGTFNGQDFASNPEAAATSNSDVFMKTGPNAGQVTTPGTPRRTISTINRTSTNLTPAGGTNPKDLPALKAIESNVLNNSGMSSIDMQTGKNVATSEAQAKIADAQSIYLNDRTIPVADAANAVKFGKAARGPNGERAYVYQGKFYKLAPSGQQMQSAPSQQQPVSALTPEDIGDENLGNYARGGRVSAKGLC